jgi:aminoglycoside phosphotransferase (APT) family kinase protein
VRDADRAWIGAQLGGRVVATRRLKGGISAQTRRVVVERPDGSRVQAVHRLVKAEWRVAEPGLVDREAALLEELEARGVPAPRLIDHQSDGGLLMTLEPGRPVHQPRDLRRHAAGLVDAAVAIHAGGPSKVDGLRRQVPQLASDVEDPAPWRHGLPVDPDHWAHVVRLWPHVTPRTDTLIHDDYHPGNVLWSRGRVTAVVDWTGAGLGQAAADITYLALDVSLVLGLEAGDLVYEAYRAATGEEVPDRPFWEVFSAARAVGAAHLWHGSWLDFGLTDLRLPVVEERLEGFVARALAAADA